MPFPTQTRLVLLGLFVTLSTVYTVGSAEQPKAAPSPPSKAKAEEPADSAIVERLIQQLGSSQFTEREAAHKALDALGEAALPALRKARNDPDAEVRRGVIDLIKILTARRAPLREKAWNTFRKLGGDFRCDTGTPDGSIRNIDLVAVALVRDEHLALLQWLDEAKNLSVGGTLITDAGLVHVKKLYRLEGLDLSGTKVTDAGMEHIKDIKSLYILNVSGTQVTDAGMPCVNRLQRLTYLYLDGTQITDAGLEHLKDLRSMYYLDLQRTQITDAGLAKLKRFQKLYYLSLKDTNVTDEGLPALKEIRTLRLLNLVGTKVTKKGMEDLERSLPKLGIVRR